jgi:hypothetical protein
MFVVLVVLVSQRGTLAIPSEVLRQILVETVIPVVEMLAGRAL